MGVSASGVPLIDLTSNSAAWESIIPIHPLRIGPHDGPNRGCELSELFRDHFRCVSVSEASVKPLEPPPLPAVPGPRLSTPTQLCLRLTPVPVT